MNKAEISFAEYLSEQDTRKPIPFPQFQPDVQAKNAQNRMAFQGDIDEG